MAWIYLMLAGMFEIGFAVGLKLMDGHKNLLWTAVFYLSIAASLFFLDQAARILPIGTAYAVWTGIGGVGVAVVGIIFFADPVNFWRVFFLGLVIVAMIGLKLTSGH